MINGVNIKDLHFVGENDRGSTFEFTNSRMGVQTVGLRNAGSINGRHYHAGKSSTKNPEIFVLLKGKIELIAKNLDTKAIMQTEIDGPKIIEIYPMVWHEIKAITDIVFIELNSIGEHATDTFTIPDNLSQNLNRV